MKVRNSLKSLRGRHRNNQLVRRKGRVYVINKTNKRLRRAKAELKPDRGTVFAVSALIAGFSGRW